jgi:hypothetical protein
MIFAVTSGSVAIVETLLMACLTTACASAEFVAAQAAAEVAKAVAATDMRIVSGAVVVVSPSRFIGGEGNKLNRR